MVEENSLHGLPARSHAKTVIMQLFSNVVRVVLVEEILSLDARPTDDSLAAWVGLGKPLPYHYALPVLTSS
jgi:hypothetical protein